ncbi:DUF2927 domain-containing protein [Pseudooceanicola sp.]|uniref:DUF2927 domain-containing protein n=1 Tax=Pseudooceanicola sp. TaxID=1914328 RepID=UPI0026241A9B|nr:DUF2927 domain-containing protein [Pseudooceanicola sp.]MDF1854113.1 DUF2927 domain-containing protein [Pseudooceanicola sp.]
MRLSTAFGLLMVLAACQPLPRNDDALSRAATAPTGQRMPPMKLFAESRGGRGQINASNADIARDFLDLAFRLESGRELPVLTRFEGPIRVRITGNLPSGMATELDRVLKRMRSEAGLDIARSSGAAGITIQAVTGDQIRRYLPQAACFVVPNVASLNEYAGVRRRASVSWASLTTRSKIAIFIPNDVSPQEMRDCLHEELAQALGPLNDLYRLDSSVFNDDNIHTVLTAFDMLILRAFYAPELRSGMTRDQVAARLPALLARLNPGGEHRPSNPLNETPRAWIEAIQSALGPGASPAGRLNAASTALKIATRQGWSDHRRAFAHYAFGRLIQASDPDSALAHYRSADAIYSRTPQTRIHRAFVRAQLAAHAIARGQGDEALHLLNGQAELARSHENAALLASIQMLQAEALEMSGRVSQARAIRRDSLGWARYGFGPEWAVRAKLSEVAALNPTRSGG